LDGDVPFRLLQTLVHGSDAVADFQADVPEKADEGFQAVGQFLIRGTGQENEQIDVGSGVEFPPAIAPHRHQIHAFRKALVPPELAQQVIHQTAAGLEQGLGVAGFQISGAQGRLALLQLLFVFQNWSGGGRGADHV